MGRQVSGFAEEEAAREASSCFRVTESFAAIAEMRVALMSRQILRMVGKGMEERKEICWRACGRWFRVK
jgi:hypothetical protein